MWVHTCLSEWADVARRERHASVVVAYPTHLIDGGEFLFVRASGDCYNGKISYIFFCISPSGYHPLGWTSTLFELTAVTRCGEAIHTP